MIHDPSSAIESGKAATQKNQSESLHVPLWEEWGNISLPKDKPSALLMNEFNVFNSLNFSMFILKLYYFFWDQILYDVTQESFF